MMQVVKKFVLFFAALLPLALCAKETLDFNTLAKQCAPKVHPTTLSALLRHESNLNPYAIGINRGASLPRQPASKSEAIATAEWLQKNGVNFDSGLGQINSNNIVRLGIPLDALFDPCTNLAATEAVLSDCYTRALAKYGKNQSALHAALSCYNTGNFTSGLKNGYVKKVTHKTSFLVPELLAIPEEKQSNGSIIENKPLLANKHALKSDKLADTTKKLQDNPSSTPDLFLSKNTNDIFSKTP